MAVKEPEARPKTDLATLVKVEILDVCHLDPHWAYETRSSEVIFNVYERLVTYLPDDLAGFGAGLAEELPTKENGGISQDGLEYRFRIRKGIRFHDGEPLTPEDVVYSFRRLLITDREHGPSWMLMEPLLGRTSIRTREGNPVLDFGEVERAVSAEGDEVVFRLRRPFAPFIAVLATPSSSIVSKSWTVAQGEWPGTAETWREFYNTPEDGSRLRYVTNGTGPFTLESIDMEREVVMRRFDGYWRGPAPLERVVILREDDRERRFALLANAECDMASLDRPDQPKVSALPGIIMADQLPTLTCDILAFTYHINPADNPYIGSGVLDGHGIPPHFFSDVHVRRAFCCCFDSARYLKEAVLNVSIRIVGPIPSGVFGHNPENPVYTLDLERARQEFQQAFGGQLWERGFWFMIGSKKGHNANRLAAQIIKENVESINPRFRIDILDQDLAGGNTTMWQRKLPLWPAGWLADYVDPHNFVQPIMSSRGNLGRVQGYYNPEAERLIEEGLEARDPAERERIYHRLQRIAYEDAIDIFTNQTIAWIPMRDWVKGWVFHPIMGPQAITDFYTLRKEPVEA